MKFNCGAKQIKLLMISFHFPPISQSSGYLRALKFAKYLPKFNISPTVLTINEQAYECTDSKNKSLLKDIDPSILVHRAWGVNTSSTLSFRGKYFSWMAIPDNWVSWIPFATFRGLLLQQKEKFDAIWVTYPIGSALFIGYFLHKLTGLPLYTDLRDPIWEEETWQATTRQKLLRWVEKKLINASNYIFFTSPGTIEKYKNRYPEIDTSKFKLITNGYDESDFKVTETQSKQSTKKLFLHSGLLPEYERNPITFFQAVGELKREKRLSSNHVLFRLRATGENKKYSTLINHMNLSDVIEIADRISYTEALQEMASTDYLMIFQHRTCDWQIPAKLFEYIRLRKQLLILAGQESDTLLLAKEAQCSYANAELDNIVQIKQAIMNCLTNSLPSTDYANSEKYSRQHLTQQLAQILENSIRT